MYRIFIITLFFVSFQLQSQESLEPLGINPKLVREYKMSQAQVSRSLNNNYIYSIDTIKLPFKDDFSIDKFKKFDAKPGDANVIDTLFHKILIAGVPDVDTAIFMLDTTYNYQYTLIGTSPDTFQIDTIALPSMGMRTICDLDVYPIVCVTVPVWSPYNTDDTLGTVASPDNIYYVLPPDIIQDSARVYFVSATDTNSLWQDNFAFRNNDYGINPPTNGVVTFDGLNENGYPYNFTSPTAYGLADYLTSKPIFLNINSSGNTATLSDSLYLSFYYQAEGLGDKPETSDSLIVQFWSPNDNKWFSVWNTPGERLDTNYKQVMIPILDAKYLKAGFKFRFANYATLSGSFDHWHIDYVFLTSFRAFNDTIRDDVAFQYPVRTLLKDYTAMPWKHYKIDPLNSMLDSLAVRQRNNSSTGKLIGSNNLEISYNGISQLIVNNPATPSIGGSTNFETKFNIPPSYFFDTTMIDTNAAFDILIRHTTTPDKCRLNDTVKLIQAFWDFYSYDDGTAEAAYGVQGLGLLFPEIAMKYNLVNGDSIKSVFMHFTPSAYNMNSSNFLITIWDDNAGRPNSIIYQNTGTDVPRYNLGTNGFYEYPLDSNFYLNAGKYYIGIVQVTADRINFGFDRNINKSSKLFYKTSGAWNTSGFEGNIMVRPSFVFQRDYLTRQKEIEIKTTTIFPNPTNSTINFSSDINLYNYTLHIIDLSGKVIYHGKARNRFDVSNYQSGIYFVKLVHNDTRKIKVAKFVKSNN